MRLGIKGKQVLGVTSIVGAVVVVLSVLHLARLAQREPRREPGARRAAGQRRSTTARARWSAAAPIRSRRCAAIPGLRSILESSLYSKNVTFAAIVDVDGVAVAHADPVARRAAAAAGGDSAQLLARSPLSQLLRDLLEPGTEPRVPRSRCCSATREIGSIRIGVSTLLIRQDLDASLRPALADRARRAGGRRCSSRRCWRSCCCGRFT